jgi:uncharacterized membrane protein YbjE (DUF340 family)
MLLVIGFLLAGMAIGLLLRKKNKLQKPVDNIVTLLVYLLLFTLGLSAGSDQSITSQFHHLGFTAITISLFTSMGSILAGWLLYKFLFLKKGNEE